MGQLDSNITYEVKPDRQRIVYGQEVEGEDGWITGIGDVAGEWEEAGRVVTCGHSELRARTVVEAMDLF